MHDVYGTYGDPKNRTFSGIQTDSVCRLGTGFIS